MSQTVDESTKNEQTSDQKHEDQVSLFRTRYEEGYDIFDSEYVEWLQLIHPESIPKSLATQSASISSPNSEKVSHECSGSSVSVNSTHCESSTTTTTLSDIRSLPKPTSPRNKRRKGNFNAKAQCLTKSEVLEELKEKKKEKEQKDKEKESVSA